mmetsp:Transcript_162645/g.516728  ORF Transcript_162645/g.516728 Transcript_162645/m.516728 type:complete len:96 (-) Transcript_162645:78-365(-)
MEEHARGGAHAEWPEQKREAEEVGSTDGASTAFARLAIDVSAKCMASSPGTRPSMDVVIESLEGFLSPRCYSNFAYLWLRCLEVHSGVAPRPVAC